MMIIKTLFFTLKHSQHCAHFSIPVKFSHCSAGRNEKGQLGCGDVEAHNGPILVEALKEVCFISYSMFDLFP